jgi:FAD/FMN-containing dehydrogenase
MTRASPLIAGLQQIVGVDHVLLDAADKAPFLREWRDLYRGEAVAVVRPGSTAEVAAVVRLAAQTATPIVPQGGNTGLVGGQIPDQAGNALVVSLTRLNRIRAVDATSDALTIEAGVTLAAAQAAADGVDRLFPLSLASEGSCTIGGNIASNAGGTAVLAYGNMRDLVLGLEVVLPDGRIWNGLSALRKDNTGYDLKHLFIGAEGTLGVITAATLKLFPKPLSRLTAFVGVPHPRAALALMARVRSMGSGLLTTFELMPRIGLEFVLRHATNVRDPLAAPHPWYVLLELSQQTCAPDLDSFEILLASAIEDGEAMDAAIAQSLDQRTAFWRLREMLSEVQRAEGGSIKHDIAVPVARIPAFLNEALPAVEALAPGCRPVPFGHLGDGNLHFNISQPVGADKHAFLELWEPMNDSVHDIVMRHGGTISAEHGIGQLKRTELAARKDPVALDLMRRIKQALDPGGIMNPGKVL